MAAVAIVTAVARTVSACARSALLVRGAARVVAVAVVVVAALAFNAVAAPAPAKQIAKAAERED